MIAELMYLVNLFFQDFLGFQRILAIEIPSQPRRRRKVHFINFIAVFQMALYPASAPGTSEVSFLTGC